MQLKHLRLAISAGKQQANIDGTITVALMKYNSITPLVKTLCALPGTMSCSCRK
jgi:hypothetical protein